MTKLHDRLYTGILRPELRLDIPFIPHIGIANSLQAVICKHLVDQLNQKSFEIIGKVETLDVICYEENTVKTIKKITLKT